MEGQLPGDSALHLMVRDNACSISNVSNGPQHFRSDWFLSRKEIEDHSPSRKDGIDLKKETQLRNLYCSFLKDLGMKLKVPQITIATAMMFCHRFFLRQSHAKNEWQTIATVSMFLAGKVEETPRALRDIVVVAYETRYAKNPTAAQRIKHKEVYEKQKELILMGEKLLLSTIGFDLLIRHPYKPLVEALKKLNITAQNDVAKVAWNFVNDWLRTTLCVQYKPHYIAAGSMYLAAWFHKVELPSEKGMVWWQHFDVAPRQLKEVIQTLVELLQQNEKAEVPCVHGKVKQTPPIIAEKAASISSHSCFLAESAAIRDLSHVLDKEMGRRKSVNLADHNLLGRSNTAHSNTSVARKKEFQPQASECGSTLSHEKDSKGGFDDGTNQSRSKSDKIVGGRSVSVCEGFSKVDRDRIKAAVKKRSWDKAVKLVAAMNNVNDDDNLWIERELELGIEVDADSSKKQRCV